MVYLNSAVYLVSLFLVSHDYNVGLECKTHSLKHLEIQKRFNGHENTLSLPTNLFELQQK